MRLKILRAIAIVICGLSAYTVVGGIVGFGFTGSNIGILISLLWAIPAAGSAYLLRWTNRRIEDRSQT